MLAKLTSKNQLTLPKAVTAEVEAADYFDVTTENGRIVLTPVRVNRADGVCAVLDTSVPKSREHDATDLLPQGTLVSHTFWESPTIEELAHSQDVRPMIDVRALFSTWPGEEEDGFEEAIDELRHSGIEVGGRL